MHNSSSFDFEDMAQAEHHVLESSGEDDGFEHEAPLEAGPQAVRKTIEIHDRARGVAVRLAIYENGTLRLTETRREKLTKAHRLDLRFLDPVPMITRHTAKRCFYTALGCAGAAALAALLAQFALLRAYALPFAVVAATASLIAALLTIYMTHQKIAFFTLHGRAPAIRLRAGFGYGRRFAKLLPRLSRAIEEAAEASAETTTVFLRQEMREHYRLRGDGILTPDDCNAGTERILTQFDGRV